MHQCIFFRSFNVLKYIFSLSLIFMIGCTERPVLSIDVSYQKDLKMLITPKDKEPIEIIGMGVIPKAEQYKIRIDPPGKADMISLQSCHREMRTPSPKKKGGWFSKKYYEFDLWPNEAHEVENGCSFDAGVFEKDKGRNAWGIIVIESDKAKLPAIANCNGKTSSYKGTSVCQAKAGLIESIHFDRPVKATEIDDCKLKEPDNGKDWIYLMPKGECTIYFVDKTHAETFHKAVLFGYDLIPIRGVN